MTQQQAQVEAGAASFQSVAAFIGIGSNIGDRLLNCRNAMVALQAEDCIKTTKTSSLYETVPVDFLDQGPFFNAVVAVKTILSPEQLLRRCQDIESMLGKKIKIPKGPRIIDLDLLFHGHLIMNSPELTLPHPEIANRHFVLIPLFEIAPKFKHPGFSLTIESLLTRLKTRETAKVVLHMGQNWALGDKG